MTKLSLALILCACMGSTAFAADVCNVAADKSKPQSELKTQLESEGWTVRQIKINKGCYEAYAVKADGTRMESLFDPATLKLLSTPAD